MHAALQYLKYENCGDAHSVALEIQRLVTEGFLTQEQGALVNPEKLARFFRTEPGRKHTIIRARNVPRLRKK